MSDIVERLRNLAFGAVLEPDFEWATEVFANAFTAIGDRDAEILRLRARVAELEAGRDWRPIADAPTLERVIVAGWQKRGGRMKGFWWVFEDVTDQDGVPMDHPDALVFQLLPECPPSPPAGGQ